MTSADRGVPHPHTAAIGHLPSANPQSALESAGRSYIPLGNGRSKAPILAPAPPHWKRYSNGPRVTFQPLALGTPQPWSASRAAVGQLVGRSYGLSRQRWRAAEDERPQAAGRTLPLLDADTRVLAIDLLRSVPSGGGCFPGELYLVATQLGDLAAGLYHYDVAHHSLDLLRVGELRGDVAVALAEPTAPMLYLLVSAVFWRSGYKYGEFSYRLHSLDLGAIIGQVGAVARAMSLRPGLHLRFDDNALDGLLGLDPQRESAYAVIALSPDAARCPAPPSAAPLPPLLAAAAVEGEPISRWPALARLHDAARRQVPIAGRLSPLPLAVGRPYRLPSPALPALWNDSSVRRSALTALRRVTLSLADLAALLLVGACGWTSDIAAETATTVHTALYCLVNDVNGLPVGSYVYHASTHTLYGLREGPHTAALQASLRGPDLNMAAASVCLILVGSYERGFAHYGDRWYRMQNLEAGACIQQLLLAAHALGLGSQVHCGFQVPLLNQLLGLPTEQTSLAQILVAASAPNGQTYEQAL